MKYLPLIKTRIRDYGTYDFDEDLIQAMYMLQTAIFTYKAEYNKTFNKYFDLILTRKLSQLKRDRLRRDYIYLKVEETDLYEEILFKEELHIDTSSLNKIELEVFKLKYENSYSYKEISEMLQISIKKSYNTVLRIKKKLNI